MQHSERCAPVLQVIKFQHAINNIKCRLIFQLQYSNIFCILICCNQNKQKKLHFKEAERKTVHFKSENILSPGEYRVGYTIGLTDNVTIFDANDDLITVNNNEGTTSGYSVVLPSDITVEPEVS